MRTSSYDPILLRSFLSVASAQNFTAAARKLGLQQSTVSIHVKRLEAIVGRRLLTRDTHSVKLTCDGATMVEFATRMLDIEERARAHFATGALRGRVRVGVSEDFVLSRLAEVLQSFTRVNPSVDLELSVGLSHRLHEMLDDGDLDLLLSKRNKDDGRGETVWRDHLVWLARDGYRIPDGAPIPLVTFPPPSITRSMAIEALEKAGIPWRITCTSQSLSGILAAVSAGLGVSAQASQLMPPSLVKLPFSESLPRVGDIEFIILSANRIMPPAVAALARMISESALSLPECLSPAKLAKPGHQHSTTLTASPPVDVSL
jgi:DNA-binding transcriptional LysR family regulator